ncbi:MAG TPA: ABC transporter permease [Vicinamibacterales bacterium]
MTRFIRDARSALRMLRNSTGFSVAAVATLAIGVGSIAAMFTIVNGVLFRALPFSHPDRLVFIGTVKRDAPARPPTVSLEELRDWQRESHTLASAAGWRDWGMARHVEGRTESVYAIVVTPDLFHVLPVRPAIGRLFDGADDREGSNHAVLLTHPYWRERFDADPRVLGRTLTLERGPVADYEIVGVLPPAFTAMPSFEDVKIVALSSIDPDAASGRDRRNRQVFARLRDGVSLADAHAEMILLAGRIAQDHPDTNAGWTITVSRLIEHEVGSMADLLRSFFAAVGFVFLITCMNIAALELARALGRRREFSIRQALGDNRLGLMRSLIVEGLVVSVLAGTLGLFLSIWLTDLVLVQGPALPRAMNIRLDLVVVAFALAISVTGGLVVAVPSAMMATRIDLAPALKEESGQIANAPGVRMRIGFVAVQLALALVLVGGAIMAGQSLVRQLTLHPGFEARGLATVSVSPPLDKYATREQITSLYARLVEEALAVPGVEGATAVSATPLSGEGAESVEFTVLDARGGESPSYSANYFNAGTAHFSTLRAPMRRGRDFAATDTASSLQVAIVNETFVSKFLNGVEPIGTRLHLARTTDIVTIVGVAGDVLRDLQPGSQPAAEIYWPYGQRPRWATTLVIRAERPGAAIASVIDRIRRLDGDVRVGTPHLMIDRVSRSSRAPRFALTLFSLVAAVAVLLSGIGVYGLVSYTVAHRTREIGIRVSLGASPRQILGQVAWSGLAAVLVGAAAGGIGLLALARPLASALPQLGTVEPLTVLAAALIVVIVGCAASYVPARRAAALNPIHAMRVP